MPESKRHAKRRHSKRIKGYIKERNRAKYNTPLPKNRTIRLVEIPEKTTEKLEQLKTSVESQRSHQKEQNFLNRAVGRIKRFFKPKTG